MIAPIDMLECQRYIEPINNEGQGNYLDHIYNITSARDDYVNPMVNKNIS